MSAGQFGFVVRGRVGGHRERRVHARCAPVIGTTVAVTVVGAGLHVGAPTGSAAGIGPTFHAVVLSCHRVAILSGFSPCGASSCFAKLWTPCPQRLTTTWHRHPQIAGLGTRYGPFLSSSFSDSVHPTQCVATIAYTLRNTTHGTDSRL